MDMQGIIRIQIRSGNQTHMYGTIQLFSSKLQQDIEYEYQSARRVIMNMLRIKNVLENRLWNIEKLSTSYRVFASSIFYYMHRILYRSTNRLIPVFDIVLPHTVTTALDLDS